MLNELHVLVTCSEMDRKRKKLTRITHGQVNYYSIFLSPKKVISCYPRILLVHQFRKMSGV